jgi:hypothetical protein
VFLNEGMSEKMSVHKWRSGLICVGLDFSPFLVRN